MHRKGWMRVVEASISILIILSILFILYNREARSDELALDQRGRDILNELATDITFRTNVLRSDSMAVNAAVAEKIPESYLDFEVRICEINDVCGMSTYFPGNIYAVERVISSSLELEGASSKKVKLFIWRAVQ